MHFYSFIRITYLYAFQSKNNVSIFVQYEYCSIQYSEYEMQFFNLIE